jgi:pimeloyl-ACP methyl ester carboxylesterase
MPRATVNGVELHYQTVGRGPDLVMVHGLAANLAFWFLTVVPRLTRDFRVTVLDLRGHGESSMPVGGYTTESLAGDLAGLIDHLGLSPVHLVGHSFGGAVALHHALLHPERVATLTLADGRVHALQPLPAGTEGPFWRARRKRLRDRGIAVTPDTPRVVFTALEELGGDELGPAGAGPRLGAWNPDSRSARKWRDLRDGTTLTRDVRRTGGLTPAAIRRLRPPMLLMFGERSRCRLTGTRLQRLLPGARNVILPGLGHFFPVQAPQLFVTHLREFIAAPAGPADAAHGAAP